MDGRQNCLRDVVGGPVILDTAILIESSSLFVWAEVYCTANFSLGGPYIRRGSADPRQAPRSLRPAGLEAHLFPSRACSDATPVIAPRHPLPGRGNSPGTHYRGCHPAKTSPVRARPFNPAEADIPTHIWEWRNGCLSIDAHSNSDILSV